MLFVYFINQVTCEKTKKWLLFYMLSCDISQV